METITTLDKLPLNEYGKIENIECIGNIKRSHSHPSASLVRV